MDELASYTVVSCPPPWPRGESRIHTAVAGPPVAVVRAEPWPEVITRPWPDGLKGLPWLPWLFGHKRTTAHSRTVVRRADGRPVLRLHEREPIFHRTVGIFDADDERVGYCRGVFKGAGDGVAVANPAHQVIGTLSKAGGSYRFTAPDGGPLGEIAAATGGYVVTATGERPDTRLFLLAAALVLISWGRLPAP